MKRILGQGYIKKIDSNGTDNILVETIKDLHPAYRESRFPIQRILDEGPIDAFEHYNFTFKLKIPSSLLYIFRYYRIAILTELPEIELDAYAPPVFLKDGLKMTDVENSELHTKYQNFYKFLFNFFNKLVKQNVAAHQLEYVLPAGRVIEFYLTINLNDLMRFLTVNLKSEMPEAKEIAQAILEYFKEEFPLTASIFLSREFPRREQP
jgi:thymidylate synthase ThyX